MVSEALKSTSCVAISLVLAMSSTSLQAQVASGQDQGSSTAAPAAAATPEEGLADIVVTAEKREGTVQRTPIAITVFTPTRLAENGIGNLGDLAQIAPSVGFSMVRTNAVVTIRGVSSRDTTDLGDPAVAVSVDGFYYQRSIGLNDSVFDLERVEVLRGPQGTLYGRNATGGAINFITAKPKQTFEASVRAGIGAYNLVNAEGVLNVPITDTLAARASFYMRRRDGFRNNAPAADGDDADARAARLHLLWEPASDLSILLTGEYVKLGGVGPTIVGAPIVRDANGQVVHDRPVLPRNRRDFPLGLPSQFLDSQSIAFRSTIEYDLGPVIATYIGGYRHLEFQRFSDGDGLLTQNVYFLSDETLETQSHELRLSSDHGGPFTWQVGGYFFQERNDLYSTQRGFPIIPTQNTAQTANFRNYFRYPVVDIKSKAAFAQASFEVTDALKLEAGIRYSDDRKFRVGVANTRTTGPLTAQCDNRTIVIACPDAFVAQRGSSNDNKVTYHAAVNFQATPDSLLYAKYDTGYKSGGFSDIVTYGPETITAYEVGSKNRFLNNNLQLNISAFYYDYSNQQVGQLIQGRTQTVNAGKSEIYGAEIEANAILSDSDRIDGSVSYLHARFTDFKLVIDGVNTQLRGNRPPQAPTLSFNLGYEHDFDIFNGTLTARAQTHYESHSFLQVFNYNSDRQNAYSRSDLILTYRPTEQPWTLMAYVRNIENAKILAFAQERAPFGAYTYQFEAPRTWGVEVSYKF